MSYFLVSYSWYKFLTVIVGALYHPLRCDTVLAATENYLSEVRHPVKRNSGQSQAHSDSAEALLVSVYDAEKQFNVASHSAQTEPVPRHSIKNAPNKRLYMVLESSGGNRYT
tara:strand:- start:66849 stop:67184 length:336 start_codon:yes stop_codon:yes gene_type:complete